MRFREIFEAPLNYTIAKGDTLSALAKKYNVGINDIAKASGIADPNKLSIGQKIVIPNQTATPAATQPTPATKPLTFDPGDPLRSERGIEVDPQPVTKPLTFDPGDPLRSERGIEVDPRPDTSSATKPLTFDPNDPLRSERGIEVDPTADNLIRTPNPNQIGTSNQPKGSTITKKYQDRLPNTPQLDPTTIPVPLPRLNRQSQPLSNAAATSGAGSSANVNAAVAPSGVKLNPSAVGSAGVSADTKTVVGPKSSPNPLGKMVIDLIGRNPQKSPVTPRSPKEAQVAAELGNAGLSTLDLMDRFKKSLGAATKQPNYSPYSNEKTARSAPNTLDGFDLGKWGRDKLAAAAAVKADQDAALADRLAQADDEAASQINLDQTFDNLSANPSTAAGLKNWMTKPITVKPSATAATSASTSANTAVAPNGVKLNTKAAGSLGAGASANTTVAPSNIKLKPAAFAGSGTPTVKLQPNAAAALGAGANVNAAITPSNVKLNPSASSSASTPQIRYNVDTNSGLRNWLNNYGKL